MAWRPLFHEEICERVAIFMTVYIDPLTGDNSRPGGVSRDSAAGSGAADAGDSAAGHRRPAAGGSLPPGRVYPDRRRRGGQAGANRSLWRGGEAGNRRPGRARRAAAAQLRVYRAGGFGAAQHGPRARDCSGLAVTAGGEGCRTEVLRHTVLRRLTVRQVNGPAEQGNGGAITRWSRAAAPCRFDGLTVEDCDISDTGSCGLS